MPKSAKIDEDPTKGAVIHAAANGINEAQLKGYVSEIESEQDRIDEIMRKAAGACQPHIDQIKAIKKEAVEAGIAKKPLNAKLRERTLRRKAEHVTDALTDAQKDIFLEISAKLGDMPLFQGLDG